METPLLRMGLLGFSPQQSQNIQGVLDTPSKFKRTRWETVAFEDADLWLLNSEAVSLTGGGLRVLTAPGAAAGSPPHMTIHPELSSKPVAFSEPVPADIEAVLSVDFASPYSVSYSLDRFANLLRPLCAKFALGEQIATRQSSLKMGIYHLHHDGRLVAVVDLNQWKVGMAPSILASEFALASWRHRPDDIGHIPSTFDSVGLERAMWVYASRSSVDRLPQGYRTDTLYLRRLSVLPQSWLHQDHMSLIGLLSRKPGNFADLQQASGLAAERLARCLTALYYIGSITSNPKSVLKMDARLEAAQLQAQEAASVFEPAGGADSGASAYTGFATSSVFDGNSYVPAVH